jgi:hypothetical protein
MQQPEAKFKAKLISLHRAAAATMSPWFTYLSPGGPGQKPGVPDLVFGDSSHGIIWVEAKMGAGVPKLRDLQPRTILSLVRCGAKVVIPCRILADAGGVSLWRMNRDGEIHLIASTAIGPALWPAIWRLP